MKYIYINLIAFIGFVTTYFAFKYGYFSGINSFVYNFPRIDSLNLPFFLITDVGGLFFISIFSIFLILFLVTSGKYKWAVYSMAALFGGIVSQTFIKNSLAISRPEHGIVSSVGYSFPSGHTNMATILLLCLCFYVFSSIENKRRKKLFILASFALILLIGFSRIYLNVHWSSDVLAGWFLGLFWATMPLALFKYKQYLGTRR